MAAVTNVTDDNDEEDDDGRFDRGVDLVLKMEGQPGIDCTDERRRTELEQPPPLTTSQILQTQILQRRNTGVCVHRNTLSNQHI